MSNSIAQELNNAGGFHENSITDSHDIDHHITPDRKAGENEEQDMSAAAEKQDAEGTATEHGALHTGTGSKAKAPFWFFNSFYWADSVNKQTGEVSWNVRPIADVVNQVISYSKLALDNAYLDLNDEDKKQATELGMLLRDTAVASEQVDSWLERTVGYAYARECAKNTAMAVKMALAADESTAAKRVEAALTLSDASAKSGRVAAMLKLALITAEPTMEINFKGGAWDVYRAEAFKHQKNFMNPDEQKASDEAEGKSVAASGLLRAAK